MEWETNLKVTISSYALTMTVNALVTGLIVFKILKVFLKVRASSSSRSIERTSSLQREYYPTSVYRIRNNRIRYGVVCQSTSSRRTFHTATSWRDWNHDACFWQLSHWYQQNVECDYERSVHSLLSFVLLINFFYLGY